MKTEFRIIILSIIFFVFVCIGDAVWEHIWLPDTSIWDALIFKVTVNDIYHRLVVTVAFLVFGLITAKVVGGYRQAEEIAANAKNEWERTFDAIPDIVFIVDRDHKIVRINKTMANRVNVNPEEAVGRPCYTFCHGLDSPHPSCPHEQAMIDGKPHEVELFEPHLGGTFFISSSPIYDENGSLAGSVHVARDITEHKRMEEKLQESEKLYRTLFDSAGDSIYIVESEGDQMGKILSANNAAARMHGYTIEELLTMNIKDLDTEESAKELPGRIARVLRGEAVRDEVMHRRKDGTVFPLEINARLLRLGDHSYTLAIDRDITERKVSEAALKASEERMRTLIEVSPIGITIVRQGVYIYTNPAFVRMFGYDDINEIVGRPLESLCVPEERAFIKKVARDRDAGLHTPQYEITGLSKDGRRLNLSVWGTMADFDGEPATFAFVVDETKEKSLRSQLIQAQKMESLGALAGGVAHDFNNLLQVVLGYSELMISSRKLDERTVADLSKINHAAKDGAELAKRLLAFSRKGEINRIPVNLNEQVEKLKGMLERTIPKMIEIRLGLNADPAMVTADPTQIDQVLLNLAVNARDAMPSGGKLNIETTNVTLDEEECRLHAGSKARNRVLLTVSDTGVGMDRQTLDQIFEPFFTTKSEGKGTGLGLSIVYGVVRRHEGFITCDSEPGKGTTFRIYLPALSENAVQNIDVGPDVTPKGGNETILLVDDEEFVRDLAVRFLTSAGYNVITASNGREAIEIFERDKGLISLIILDLIMPEIGGLQCLEEIKKIDPKARVLIASGLSVDESDKKIIESSARGFVSKPYQVKQALDAVRMIIDEG
ncbi:MAG: hybrid sensor histidine kinase/response regulator [Desulfomonilaceae bacterium]